MNITCDVKDFPNQPTLAIRTRSPAQNLQQVLGESYMEIMKYMQELEEPAAGAPFVIYYNMDVDDLDVEIGIPVAKKLPDKGDVKASEICAGKAASCIYTGPYTELKGAYDELNKWMEDNNHEPAGAAIEIYLNDPGITPPEELKTEIRFPLK